VSAWAQVPQGGTIIGVSDWLTCMTADAVVKASMGLVSKGLIITADTVGG
jgi:hypothetical protein